MQMLNHSSGFEGNTAYILVYRVRFSMRLVGFLLCLFTDLEDGGSISPKR
jgi:hypothetical protein